MLASEVAADLLRAPALREQFGDSAPQRVVGVDPASVAASPPGGGHTVSIEGPIAAGAGIAAQFPRHRRRGTTHSPCDLPHRQSLQVQIGDLDPLVLR